MKDISEAEVIRKCLEGDQQAWNEIYRRFYSRVRQIAAWQKWGFSSGEVEDQVQEVFLELVRALPNFRFEASMATFITRLTKNKCVSYLRRKGAQKRGKEEVGFIFEEKKDSEDSPRVIIVSEDASPDEALVLGEESREVLEGMKQLSRECVEIIYKRYYEEQSYQEICDELKLPIGTVCSRLKRCLLKLRQILEKSYDFSK